MAKIDTDAYRVKPGTKVDLSKIPSRVAGGLKRGPARELLRQYVRQLDAWQEKLYAEGKQSLLLVFQAMDAGGKDSTIRRVLGPLNPAGVRVHSFKVPTSTELAHDYLWRIHRATPARGYIGVFNRSHYEDVLIVRVKDLAPKKVWQRRYEHINQFEKILTDEGTTILKFYLHISKEYQRARLQRRLDRADKHWKFSPSDLKERARWGDYAQAFNDALSRCSSEHAPWYIIPAERRWFRNVLVAQIILNTLTKMNPQLPRVDFDPSTIVIE